MRHLWIKLRVFLPIAVLALTVSAVAAEPKEPTSSKPVFVDLDGDGFNDAAKDANNDGIPDPEIPEEATVSETSGMQVRTISLMPELTQTPAPVSRPSWKATFGQRRLSALGLTLSRCNFEAVSGGDDASGTGGLGGGGGACAGGVCLPH